MSKFSKQVGLWSALAGAAVMMPGAAQAVDFGKPGEPVKLGSAALTRSIKAFIA